MRSVLLGIEAFGIGTHVTVEFATWRDVVMEIKVYWYASADGRYAFSMSKFAVADAPGDTIPANQSADTLAVVGIGVCRLIAQEFASSL